MKTFFMNDMYPDNPDINDGIKNIVDARTISLDIAQAFIDHYSNIIWVADREMNVLYANRTFYEFFYLKDASGKSAGANQMPPQIIDLFRVTHQNILETGKGVSKEMTIQNAEGKDFAFKVHMFPVKTEENLVGGYAISVGRSDSHYARTEGDQRYLQLIQSSSEAIWEWEINTGNTFKNNALLELIGFEKEETKGLSWWMQQIHPEDRKRINDNIKVAITEKRRSWNDFYRFLCKDGTYKHIRARAFLIYENELPVRIIGTLTDVTELIELENQLAEERMKKQQEISENVICTLERERTMIGRELHDNVNQLLAVSRLYVSLLNPVADEDKQIKKILLEQLEEVINEIRNVSRELVIPHLKKKGLVASINELIGKLNELKKIQISFKHDRQHYRISQGKKLALYRIIQEQCNNIIKHSDASQANINLSLIQNFLELTIHDNGIGFAADIKNKGLGLSNIQERTLFYDGVVDIKSAEGQGCQITVLIPV